MPTPKRAREGMFWGRVMLMNTFPCRTTKVIPDAAIEAAARAMLAAGNHIGGWENLPAFMRDQLQRDARAALEAAASHMLTKAYDRGFTDCTRGWVAQREDPSHPITRNNPYRVEA